MKKVFLSGLVAGVVILAAQVVLSMFVFDKLIPSLADEYKNPSLFRPWSDPLMSLMYVTPFIGGFIMAWIWNYIKSAFNNFSPSTAGLMLGFMVWLLGLPGMVISYGTFPISFIMVLSWTLSNLIQLPLGGLVIANMNKPNLVTSPA